jgi:hypothetical protein
MTPQRNPNKTSRKDNGRHRTTLHTQSFETGASSQERSLATLALTVPSSGMER